MTTTIIIGDRTDSHVQAVLTSLSRIVEFEPLLVDAPALTSSAYSLHDGCLTVAARSVDLNADGRGWMRRYAPTLWGAGAVAGSLESARKRAFLTLVGSITRLGGRQWLTPLEAMLRAEDRLLQLQVARTLGFHIPRTVVTSNGRRAHELLGDQFVLKPLSNGYYHTTDGPRAVFTTPMTAAELDLVEFADAPFVAQELIAVREHLRVVTVRDRAWVATLDPEGRPIDWRQQDEAHFAWRPARAPDLVDRARAMASELGVGYTSQDWVRDDTGEPIFLDLNPGGQWLFLPEEVSMPVTDAIARFLGGASS